MRRTPFPIPLITLTFALSLLTCGSALGQTNDTKTPPGAGVPATDSIPTRTAVEQRTEHIRLEDGGSLIDEIRVGGETKSITVLPKGGMPAYQVAPVSGERSWKVLGF